MDWYKGNIDLYNRPQVPNNGGISTLFSMSFNDNGKEVLIPRVSKDGRIMSPREAVDCFYRTGEHLGKFDTVDEANAMGQRLHKQQESLGALYQPVMSSPSLSDLLRDFNNGR